MDLLPKESTDFAKKDYWDAFFKQRGKEAFEWYGEYPELCVFLHKYIKAKDNVLIVGCGNSKMGNDLYDAGYRNITSIDISKIPIQQLTKSNAKKRPEMKFLEMDATQMSFADASFSVVVDKGTLDALMPDDKQPTIDHISNYMGEILRVLSNGGRYVCISLLQEHILHQLLSYFPSHHCMFRVVKCFDSNATGGGGKTNSMPVFMVVCTKFMNMPTKLLEVSLHDMEKMVRVSSEAEIIRQVAGVQHNAFLCNGLKNMSIADENVWFNISKPGEESIRYTIYVTDILKSSKKIMPYAAFIVPQGRETDWLFATLDGRKRLAEMSQYNRLLVVTLHRDQVYENLDKVKAELGDLVQRFAPAKLGPGRIPFLSLGDDVGERVVRHRGKSTTSGEYLVEDVTVTGVKFRRLFYIASGLVIQSEARLKQTKSRSGNLKECIDATYLICEYHVYISCAVQIAAKLSSASESTSLIVGLGGGGLCSFLRKFNRKLQMEAIDIDPAMLQVATEWFDLVQDEHLHVTIQDGILYLAQNNKLYDSIVFDVDSKDQTIGQRCPPKEFLSDSTLQRVRASLTEHGVFIVNVVLRDEQLRPPIVSALKQHFGLVAAYKLKEDVNEVFVCCAAETQVNAFRKQYSAAKKELDAFLIRHKHEDLVRDDIDGKSLLIC